MSNADVVGLRQVVDGGTDGELSYGVIPFDKNGVCSGPQTRDAIVAEAANATDVFVFSHGWNNDWAAANARYARFIEEYTVALAAGRANQRVYAAVYPLTNVLRMTRQGFLEPGVTWHETWPGLVALVAMIAVLGTLAARGLRKLGP